MTVLTSKEIEAAYADDQGMEAFARKIETAVLMKVIVGKIPAPDCSNCGDEAVDHYCYSDGEAGGFKYEPKTATL